VTSIFPVFNFENDQQSRQHLGLHQPSGALERRRAEFGSTREADENTVKNTGYDYRTSERRFTHYRTAFERRPAELKGDEK